MLKDCIIYSCLGKETELFLKRGQMERDTFSGLLIWLLKETPDYGYSILSVCYQLVPAGYRLQKKLSVSQMNTVKNTECHRRRS